MNFVAGDDRLVRTVAVKPLRLRGAAARLRGLTAPCGQAKWLIVPLMPHSPWTKTKLHLHRNLLHKIPDTPGAGIELASIANPVS